MIQLVKQSVTPLGPCPSDEVEMLKRIEMAGRTAYKSEDKITEDSALGFVQRMKKSGHLSVLEHSNICLLMRYPVDDTGYFWRLFKERGAFHVIRPIQYESKVGWAGYHVAIAGNVRSWLETLKVLDSCVYQWFFQHFLNQFFPSLFDPIDPGCLKTMCDSLGAMQAELVTNSSPPDHELQAYTFHIVCDRGISHEIVRHRVLSFTQESTRYVNYGNKGTEFIMPEHLEEAFDPEKLVSDIRLDDWMELREYEDACQQAYNSYYQLLNRYHRKPQIARDVLPNLLKTEMYVSGRWSGWKHFIELRDSPAAHPRIQKIAQEIRTYFAGIGLEM